MSVTSLLERLKPEVKQQLDLQKGKWPYHVKWAKEELENTFFVRDLKYGVVEYLQELMWNSRFAIKETSRAEVSIYLMFNKEISK